jgi:hypothetical protein
MDLSWGLYFPVILAAFAYGAISAVAGIMSGRGNEGGAERMRDAGFLLILASGVWVIVLFLLALLDEPDDLWDMVVIHRRRRPTATNRCPGCSGCPGT